MAEQPPITTVEAVAAWIGKSGAHVSAAYKAAEAYVGTRCTWPLSDDGTWPPAPDELVQAVAMLTARYLARRNSPDGYIGLDELGRTQVPTLDRDVDRLIAPYRRVVLA